MKCLILLMLMSHFDTVYSFLFYFIVYFVYYLLLATIVMLDICENVYKQQLFPHLLHGLPVLNFSVTIINYGNMTFIDSLSV